MIIYILSGIKWNFKPILLAHYLVLNFYLTYSYIQFTSAVVKTYIFEYEELNPVLV